MVGILHEPDIVTSSWKKEKLVILLEEATILIA